MTDAVLATGALLLYPVAWFLRPARSRVAGGLEAVAPFRANELRPDAEGKWVCRVMDQLGIEFPESTGAIESLTFHERGTERLCPRVGAENAVAPPPLADVLALRGAEAFERATGRELTDDERAEMVREMHQAARWTYLGSGMVHEKFLGTLGQLSPEQRRRIENVAPVFA